MKNIQLMLLLLVSYSATADVVSYTAGSDQVRFNNLKVLSDSSVLVVGEANGLGWVPASTKQVQIDASDINSKAEGQIAFIARFNKEMTVIQQLVHFPKGTLKDVYRLRSDELPDERTGNIYISGSRELDSWNDTGYYIAKLDNNFIDGMPTKLVWTHDVIARPRRATGRKGVSAYKTIQPWDVTHTGDVIFGKGSEYDFDWAGIYKLNNKGKLTTVPNWPAHWQPNGEMCYSISNDCDKTPEYSGIVLKAGRIGSLRSRTEADYKKISQDANGNDRQGSYPDDYFFNSHCAIGDCPSTGPGYTGYKKTDTPTQRLGGITIDRRTGDMYFGYSTQSKLPDGNPDFEPALVAMKADGSLKWWQRLYKETEKNSPPDQYVDAVEIDYANDRVVVLARAHGNAIDNLFNGNEIKANPDAKGFQNRFTGNKGDIHISWLGKLGLSDGALHASTYVAEFGNSGKGTSSKLMKDPNLNQFPNPNAGWPNLNTTRCRSHLHIGKRGEVVLTCEGRRVITTNNAHHSMYPIGQGQSKWSEFVRVYTPDLSNVMYSSLVTGEWNSTSASHPTNTKLVGASIQGDRVLISGYHMKEQDSEKALFTPIITANVPSWGADKPVGETAIWGVLSFDNTAPIDTNPKRIFSSSFEKDEK